MTACLTHSLTLTVAFVEDREQRDDTTLAKVSTLGPLPMLRFQKWKKELVL